MPADGHARLSPSSAHIWTACPGSVHQPRPERVGSSHAHLATAANIGQAAHLAAERALAEGLEAEALIGTEHAGVVIDAELAATISMHLDFVRGEAETGQLATEVQVDLAPLDIPEPCFGTVDALITRDRTLTVVDLKTGMRTIEVEGNLQLRAYGLGAMLGASTEILYVDLVIVQPRAPHRHGPIRREALNRAALMEWGEWFRDAIHLASDPGAPLVPGSWCWWCPARETCLARAEFARRAAVETFSEMSASPDARIVAGGSGGVTS